MNKSVVAVLALALVVLAGIFAAPPARAEEPEPQADATVIEVNKLDEDMLQVVTGAGYIAGALPGARLEIVDPGGKVMGWVMVSATEEHRSSGLFEAACEKCRPKPGQNVFILHSGLELPPKIETPAETAAPGEENLTDEDYLAIETAFRTFMDGGPLPGSGSLVAAGDAGSETACPEMSARWKQEIAAGADPDAEIETDIFISEGDVLLLTGLRDKPICGVVHETVVGSPELAGIIAAGRTIADFENRVKMKHVELVGRFDVTVMPKQYMARRIEVHIIGDAAVPGVYAFDEPVSPKEAIAKAGVIPSFDGRLVLVKRKDTGGAEIIRTKVSPPGYDLPDAPADTMSLGDNDIIFLVRSEKHEKQFLEEVLPYLVAQTAE